MKNVVTRFFRSISALLFIIMMAGCSANVSFLFQPPATATPLPTATPTLTPSPTVTPTPPSVPHGLRKENAATMTFEDGFWLTRNSAGEVTAQWNDVAGEWDYNEETILIEQVILGYEGMSTEFLEPFLKPLPPDEPSTHFINPETGEPVDYGVGPRVLIDVQGSVAGTHPATEFFARFRGFASDPTPADSKYPLVAQIFELPRSPDSTLVFVTPSFPENLRVWGMPDNNLIYDQYGDNIIIDSLVGESAIQTANDSLRGQMVMFYIFNYVLSYRSDPSRKSVIDFISGKSSQIPVINVWDGIKLIRSIYIPISQYPTQP